MKLDHTDPAQRALWRIITKLTKVFLLLEIDPEMSHRADGRMVCEQCGNEYWRHADHPNGPWLTVLCDGRRVHL